MKAKETDNIQQILDILERQLDILASLCRPTITIETNLPEPTHD